MKRPPRNVAASHRAKLLALARDRGEDFRFLLTRIAHATAGQLSDSSTVIFP